MDVIWDIKVFLVSFNFKYFRPLYRPCLLILVICTDCTGSCKSNYHTITTTMAPGNCSILVEVDRRIHVWLMSTRCFYQPSGHCGLPDTGHYQPFVLVSWRVHQFIINQTLVVAWRCTRCHQSSSGRDISMVWLHAISISLAVVVVCLLTSILLAYRSWWSDV